MATTGPRPGRRADARWQLDREIDDLVRRLGRDLRPARRRRRWRQQDVADQIGVSRSAYSRMELGRARGAPIEDWLTVAMVLGLRPRFELARDPLIDAPDAGHLAMQDLLLRLAPAAGYVGSFEVSVKPDTRHSIDICLRDPRRRLLVVVEAWNTIGDVGAARRSFDRKLAAAAEVGAWIGGGGHVVRGVWVVRASRRNRSLVARYPAVFGTAFPGSSRGWVAALVAGAEPPEAPGLVWCDVAATRLFEWRR